MTGLGTRHSCAFEHSNRCVIARVGDPHHPLGGRVVEHQGHRRPDRGGRQATPLDRAAQGEPDLDVAAIVRQAEAEVAGQRVVGVTGDRDLDPRARNEERCLLHPGEERQRLLV